MVKDEPFEFAENEATFFCFGGFCLVILMFVDLKEKTKSNQSFSVIKTLLGITISPGGLSFFIR